MKKLALALMAAVAVFGATAYATPAQAATHSTIVPNSPEGTVLVVYFDHYPPSTYSDDSGFYGYLINVRTVSGGLWEGTYYSNFN
ncbi:hypothetical protein [Tumebacillus flagellatus]|uniref:Uncharacterized protein n=1 Tax=Tumebacillus flagellatus TaxID=1157490 RepID=A0A074LR69_9BACL|nr:hypothetical protein [Tumebacillus flagellatus]KEO82328.1 hypothetical protein EL26_16245 [Tumebacillus flagellatus]